MASPVNTSVKFFTSDMVGAPAGFSGTVGSGLPVIHACLVTGFGTVTLTSLVVSGGIATATFPTTHSAVPESVVLISGVTNRTELNGEQKILTKVGNTVTFATAEPNSTATGTITMGMAPLGWTRPFTGANLAVYRAPDVDGTRFFLRIDDTVAADMRVVGYETMSAISTGSNLFPTAAQQVGGLYWPKSDAVSSTTNPWMIIGDGKRFYLCVATYFAVNSAFESCYSFGFGDFTSYKATVDSFAAFLCGSINAAAWTGHLGFLAPAVDTSLSLTRSAAGAVGAVSADRINSLSGSAGGVSGSSNALGPFPGVSDSLILTFTIIGETITTNGPRGRVAGVWLTPQSLQLTDFVKNDLVVGASETVGRKLLVVPIGSGQGSTGTAMFVDITGPW